jgi:hypothetical protein
MGELRKITVQVPENDLEMAQAYTGEGVTETVRAGLKKLASIQAQHELDNPGPDLELLKPALIAGDVVLPPVVLAEVLSDFRLPDRHRDSRACLP